MYYLCSENKVADLLHSYCAANLHLCFRICKVFSSRGSFCICFIIFISLRIIFLHIYVNRLNLVSTQYLEKSLVHLSLF